MCGNHRRSVAGLGVRPLVSQRSRLSCRPPFCLSVRLVIVVCSLLSSSLDRGPTDGNARVFSAAVSVIGILVIVATAPSSVRTFYISFSPRTLAPFVYCRRTDATELSQRLCGSSVAIAPPALTSLASGHPASHSFRVVRFVRIAASFVWLCAVEARLPTAAERVSLTCVCALGAARRAGAHVLHARAADRWLMRRRRVAHRWRRRTLRRRLHRGATPSPEET